MSENGPELPQSKSTHYPPCARSGSSSELLLLVMPLTVGEPVSVRLEGILNHQDVDFVDQGSGPIVVLVHSSVAGARQWRSLMEHLADSYRLIAVNLYGYGKTPPWEDGRPQTLTDQARLIERILPKDGSQVSLLGHSLGGSVAMKASTLYPDRVKKLVLFEPNPFYLLDQSNRHEAYLEAVRLRDCIKEAGKTQNWLHAAAEFADYWNGAGSWDAMPDDRKEKFAEALKPNFHEWDAVIAQDLSLEEWRSRLPRETTIISAADTVRTIRELVELLSSKSAGWKFETLATGGHMAPLSNPHLVNPVFAQALA